LVQKTPRNDKPEKVRALPENKVYALKKTSSLTDMLQAEDRQRVDSTHGNHQLSSNASKDGEE
jgi:hypothetical protein